MDPTVIEKKKKIGTTRSSREPRSRLGEDSPEKCVCLVQVSMDETGITPCHERSYDYFFLTGSPATTNTV